MGARLCRIEHPLDSVWNILHERVYEGWREPYVDFHEFEKAVSQKWNATGDQTLKKAVLLWKKLLRAVTK